jgi:plastocyanin
MRRGRFPGKRHFVLAAALGAGVAVLPAIASSETTPVEAVNEGGTYGETHRWSPSQETVIAGNAVTFRNQTAVRHGVNWINPPAKPVCDSTVPVGTTEAAAGTNWSGACTFAQAGTYTFYCTVHGAAMSGTITVNPNGTTTPTTTPTTTMTTTATTPGEPPSGSPLVGGPSLHSNQRGGFVKGSLNISEAGAGGRLEIDVFAKSASLARAGRATRVRVGRLVRSSLSAGKLSFAVKLNARARRALKRHRRLALTVRIVLMPVHGEPSTITRGVVEHA